jgi:hypothetical protein
MTISVTDFVFRTGKAACRQLARKGLLGKNAVDEARKHNPHPIGSRWNPTWHVGFVTAASKEGI